jgi:hypothetical protein
MRRSYSIRRRYSSSTSIISRIMMTARYILSTRSETVRLFLYPEGCFVVSTLANEVCARTTFGVALTDEGHTIDDDCQLRNRVRARKIVGILRDCGGFTTPYCAVFDGFAVIMLYTSTITSFFVPRRVFFFTRRQSRGTHPVAKLAEPQ